jgi:hypothetical protein
MSKNQAEIFWQDLFDCEPGHIADYEPFQYARNKYHAKLIKSEPYDDDDQSMTTWKFPDNSIAFIIGHVDEKGEHKTAHGFICLLPGMSIEDHAELCCFERDDHLLN